MTIQFSNLGKSFLYKTKFEKLNHHATGHRTKNPLQVGQVPAEGVAGALLPQRFFQHSPYQNKGQPPRQFFYF